MSRYKLRLDKRTGECYYLHRAMAEWKLGRQLSPAEVVHHINGNTSDNHPDNLLVFPSQRVHMLWHHYLWREARGISHLFSFEDILRAHACPNQADMHAVEQREEPTPPRSLVP